MPERPRLHYVDRLRVGAIASVFVFHTLRPFADEWHVNNVERSPVIVDALFFFWTFGLAMLFFLAGAGTRFALRRRTWGAFLRERTMRLLVPFAVGTLLLSPIQALIEAAHDGTLPASLTVFLGAWARGVVDALSRGFSPTVFGIGYHLWFLGFLFTIAIAGLPLCTALMSARGQALVAWTAARMKWPGSPLAFAVPIALLIGAFAPFGGDEHDWFEWGWYFAYFMAGFVVFGDDRFLAAARRDVMIAFAVAVGSTAALAWIDLGDWAAGFGDRGIDWTYPVVGTLFALEGWSWTIAILGVALRWSAMHRPVSERIGDAVLPVYVVHQPVILAVAFFVVQLPLGILPKWLLIFGIALAVTLVLVELALRAPAIRVLLGARLRGSSEAPVRARAVGARAG